MELGVQLPLSPDARAMELEGLAPKTGTGKTAVAKEDVGKAELSRRGYASNQKTKNSQHA